MSIVLPVPDLTTPFDLSFDNTFQYLLPTVNIAVPDCKMPGVYLHWLSLRGWASYLFAGNSEDDFDVKSGGRFEQGGADRDTYKKGQRQLLIRAGGLTPVQSEVIKSLYLSPAVYALAPDKNGKLKAVLVRVEEGTFAVWRDANQRINIDCKIYFPKIKSQRA